MNFSNPILICDENEEFRVLIRDMLTKNGFFHVIEASSQNEIIEHLKERKDYFVLIDQRILSDEITKKLFNQKNYIVFADNSDDRTPLSAARLGVKHILSYPFPTRKLIEKINTLI